MAIPSVISSPHDDPAQLSLLWDVNNASFLTKSPKSSITSPAFATPQGDIWRLKLKPKGVRHGGEPCRIMYESGREPVHFVTKGQVSVMTPQGFVWTTFFRGPLPVVKGGEVSTNTRYECRPRVDDDGEGDRVTVQVRLWLDEGVPRPPVDFQATSTLRLTPLIFTASYDGKGVERRLLLDVPARKFLKRSLQMEMWSPDGDRWGIIVHLSGHLFDAVQSLKGTFILAHRCPIDPAKVIVTNMKRTVLFHRWNKGSSFRVPPFIPKGPVTIVCDFLTYSGDMEEEYYDNDEISYPLSLRPPSDVMEQQQDVKLVVDVEQDEELISRRPRSELMGCLSYILNMGTFANAFLVVLLLVVAVVVIVSVVYGIQFGSMSSRSSHSVMD